MSLEADREGAKETSVTLQAGQVFKGQGDGEGRNERGSTSSKISQEGSSRGERDLSSLRRTWRRFFWGCWEVSPRAGFRVSVFSIAEGTGNEGEMWVRAEESAGLCRAISNPVASGT